MPRWEPDARGRLLQAALQLFSEQGYEATTAVQIAERAGVTKTTLFRHFTDKREILFYGQPALVDAVAAGVGRAPEGASAVGVLEAGLCALCDVHDPAQQEIGRQINRIVAASAELQERAVYKRSTIAAALETALDERFQDPYLAGALADVGVRAYYQGFAVWVGRGREARLEDAVLEELRKLQSSLLGLA